MRALGVVVMLGVICDDMTNVLVAMGHEVAMTMLTVVIIADVVGGICTCMSPRGSSKVPVVYSSSFTVLTALAYSNPYTF